MQLEQYDLKDSIVKIVVGIFIKMMTIVFLV